MLSTWLLLSGSYFCSYFCACFCSYFWSSWCIHQPPSARTM
jgi:hypothetical protein